MKPSSGTNDGSNAASECIGIPRANENSPPSTIDPSSAAMVGPVTFTRIAGAGSQSATSPVVRSIAASEPTRYVVVSVA